MGSLTNNLRGVNGPAEMALAVSKSPNYQGKKPKIELTCELVLALGCDLYNYYKNKKICWQKRNGVIDIM
jgi:hypothetical protein